MKFDSKVKTWPFWVANIADGYEPSKPAPKPEPIPGLTKDSTHIATADRRGHLFDAPPTPSGPGSVSPTVRLTLHRTPDE